MGATPGQQQAQRLAPCRAFCAAQGWTVVEVYIDDGRSAWREGVRRDDFERMPADVRAGRIDGIVSWQIDRLLRRVEDASAIIHIAKQYKTTIANVDGARDLTTASGRKKFHDAAVAAELASDLASERLRLKHAELAADGKFSGGTRPFGYLLEEYVYQDATGRHLKYRLVVNPEEAAAIAKAAEEVTEDGRSARNGRPGTSEAPGAGCFAMGTSRSCWWLRGSLGFAMRTGSWSRPSGKRSSAGSSLRS